MDTELAFLFRRESGSIFGEGVGFEEGLDQIRLGVGVEMDEETVTMGDVIEIEG